MERAASTYNEHVILVQTPEERSPDDYLGHVGAKTKALQGPIQKQGDVLFCSLLFFF